MQLSSRISVLVASAALAVSTAAVLPADSATAASSGRPTAPKATILAHQSVGDAAVVTNDQGISLAMWLAGGSTRPYHLAWAVRRPGHAWTSPRVKLDHHYRARHVPYAFGARPSLAATTHHRIAATWVDHQGRVVVQTWSPTAGWSRVTHLSNARHRALWPTIVANPSGSLAVAWEMGRVGTRQLPGSAMVAVRRHGTWSTQRVGRAAEHFGAYVPRIRVGMAGDGAVTVLWQRLHAGRAATTTTTLPSGSATWAPRQVFTGDAAWGERYQIGLAVQPDGSALVNPQIADGMSQRVGAGAWTHSNLWFQTRSLTTADGALVTWNSAVYDKESVYEDPDGLAGPLPQVDLGRPAFRGAARIDHVLALPDGTLVDVSVNRQALAYAVREPGQDWSAPVTVKTFTRFLNPGLDVTPSISADGVVDVLVGTRARFNSHLPHDLRALRFRAVRRRASVSAGRGGARG